MRAKIQAGPVTGATEAEKEKVSLLQRMLQYRVFTTHACMADQDIISEGMGHMYVIISALYWCID